MIFFFDFLVVVQLVFVDFVKEWKTGWMCTVDVVERTAPWGTGRVMFWRRQAVCTLSSTTLKRKYLFLSLLNLSEPISKKGYIQGPFPPSFIFSRILISSNHRHWKTLI